MADARFYLLDNLPVTRQFHPSRNAPLTGGIILHTTESVMDTVGPDTGAENVAAFIARRSDYGSYHTLVDSDSTVRLVPDTYTAFHVAESGYNSRTFGLSFACRSTDLNPDSAWTQAAMKRAAAELVRFWRENGFDPAACARFRPASELLSGAGISTHGEAQPRDRSDAWTRHPRRADLERLLLREVAALTIPTAPGVTTVNTPYFCRFGTQPEVWLCWENSPFRIHIKSPAEVDLLRYLGVKDKGSIAPAFKAFSSALAGG
jgi:hypothetical protein